MFPVGSGSLRDDTCALRMYSRAQASGEIHVIPHVKREDLHVPSLKASRMIRYTPGYGRTSSAIMRILRTDIY